MFICLVGPIKLPLILNLPFDVFAVLHKLRKLVLEHDIMKVFIPLKMYKLLICIHLHVKFSKER